MTQISQKQNLFWKSDFIWLAVCILIAALIRLDFVTAGNFVIDSDEAIVGLMAKHIIEGQGIPTFYYGQHYMGSLEPLCVALSFWLFGISNLTLQIVPIFFSLCLILIVFALTRELAGGIAARFAALYLALPPVGLTVWSFKARGGFIEVLVLGALALFFMCRWFKQKHFSLCWTALLGLILGVGWWVNNQIVYFIAPIGLFVVFFLLHALFQKEITTRQLARVIGVGVGTFLVGSAPYWIYNFENGFPSLGMFGFAESDEIAEHFEGLFSTALPIILGGKEFWDSSEIFTSRSILYLSIYAISIFTVCAARWRKIARLLTFRIDKNAPLELLTLFLIFSCTIFAVSTFGWLVQAPRYLLPLYVGLAPLVGVAVEIFWFRSKAVASLFASLILVMNLSSNYLPADLSLRQIHRAIPGEPVVFNGERVDHDSAPLISELTKRGITKVSTNYWIGYRLAFETKEAITFLVFQDPEQIRIPRYEENLSEQERDRLPIVTVPSQALLIRRAFSSLGIRSEEVVVGKYVLFDKIVLPKSELVRVDLASVKISVGGPIRNFNGTEAAVDQSLKTRWGTGIHQQPGQIFTMIFPEPLLVSALKYDLASWRHDYPRGLSISITKSDGTKEELLTDENYTAIRYLLPSEHHFELRFPPILVTSIILTQEGRHPIVDWSIAEISLYKTKESP